jgi:hypothetical protein
MLFSGNRGTTGWATTVHFPVRSMIGFFLFVAASRLALGLTQTPTGIGGFYPGVKRAGLEADHSLPSNAEVKNVLSYTSTPPIRLHVVLN